MKKLKTDRLGALVQNRQYCIDNVTELFEVVYLMPFFVRILNGVEYNGKKNAFNRYWSNPKRRMYLQDYRAVFHGVSACGRYAVLEMIETGQEIRVIPGCFTKRFSDDDYHLNQILSKYCE